MTKETRIAALARVRADVLDFGSGLTDAEWATPSAAEGWSVQDVIAHMAAGCHSLFTPAALSLLRSSNIESTNDDAVEMRRGRSHEQILAEYETWSRRTIRMAGAVLATPVSRVRVPLAELGRFPARQLLTGALVFDYHTHLRYDMAPALGRDLPPEAPGVLAVATDWMIAVLNNQIKNRAMRSTGGPLHLILTGEGGGEWTVTAGGVARGRSGSATATITADVSGFAGWGTKRTPWAEGGLDITGDSEVASGFLDQLNIV